MSVELVALVVSTLTMLLGFVTVIGWLVTRTDRQFDKLRDDLGSRIDGVEREIVEVKIAVARIEGPPRQFLASR